MKQNFKDGKIKGWAINSDKNRRSYPEKYFLKVFDNNEIFDKYEIIEKHSYGKYFIDFLFVELKMVFVVDGDQHFKNEEAIEYDRVRDEYFLNEGFKVYRVRWKDVFHNPQTEINELTDFIKNIDRNTYRKYVIDDCKYIKPKRSTYKYRERIKTKKCNVCDEMVYSETKNCRVCHFKIRKENAKKNKIIKYTNSCVVCDTGIHGLKMCKECYDIDQRTIERPTYYQLVKEIDETNYVSVGKKYGVSDNAIRKWVKYYEKIKEEI